MIEHLLETYQLTDDMSHLEEKEIFLESTSSMVFDRVNRCVYAGISPRTNADQLKLWCEKNGFELVQFETESHTGSAIYHTDVIEYKPAISDEEMESEYEKALKNVLCLMILADKKVEEEEISTVSNIYNKLTNDKKFTKNQIDKNITQLKKDKKTVNQYLKKIKPYLNSGHRELIIKAMYFVASSDGHLDKKEGELLMKTANVLEMTSAHVKGVLAELDKKNNN